MSGGSMGYLYRRVLDAEFDDNTAHRRALRAHLDLVAEALRAVEWVDSGDWGVADEEAAILACVGHAAIESAKDKA